MADVVFVASFTIQDELGVQATMPVFLQGPDTATLANIHTSIVDIGNELDAIIGGRILEATVTFHPVNGTTWKTAADAGSRVEQTGLFNYSNDTTPYKFGIDVPSLSDAVLDGPRIDLDNSDIGNFVDLFTAAIGVFTAVTNGYDPLVALLDAALTFRKRRKQLTRVSKEPA